MVTRTRRLRVASATRAHRLVLSIRRNVIKRMRRIMTLVQQNRISRRNRIQKNLIRNSASAHRFFKGFQLNTNCTILRLRLHIIRIDTRHRDSDRNSFTINNQLQKRMRRILSTNGNLLRQDNRNFTSSFEINAQRINTSRGNQQRRFQMFTSQRLRRQSNANSRSRRQGCHYRSQPKGRRLKGVRQDYHPLAT